MSSHPPFALDPRSQMGCIFNASFDFLLRDRPVLACSHRCAGICLLRCFLSGSPKKPECFPLCETGRYPTLVRSESSKATQHPTPSVLFRTIVPLKTYPASRTPGSRSVVLCGRSRTKAVAWFASRRRGTLLGNISFRTGHSVLYRGLLGFQTDDV